MDYMCWSNVITRIFIRRGKEKKERKGSGSVVSDSL